MTVQHKTEFKSYIMRKVNQSTCERTQAKNEDFNSLKLIKVYIITLRNTEFRNIRRVSVVANIFKRDSS